MSTMLQELVLEHGSRCRAANTSMFHFMYKTELHLNNYWALLQLSKIVSKFQLYKLVKFKQVLKVYSNMGIS